ncbi:MAG: 5-formyltetrahydrofolate cyclo-ligase [Pseudomonadota bacterium]
MTLDIAAWRKEKRAELIAARMALPVEERTRVAAEVATQLDQLIPTSGARGATVVSVYWPFRGELDLRDWMRAGVARGLRIALPVVVEKGQPLIFREWVPGARLTRGVWNIPIPADGSEVTPDVLISPFVGFDPQRYRLGYGGGFFDRTLAALKTPRTVIGVGHPSGALPTIHPQPHDIPMDIIITA